jgi:hypothetical protein
LAPIHSHPDKFLEVADTHTASFYMDCYQHSIQNAVFMPHVVGSFRVRLLNNAYADVMILDELSRHDLIIGGDTGYQPAGAIGLL